jgi:hypothetical protein
MVMPGHGELQSSNPTRTKQCWFAVKHVAMVGDGDANVQRVASSLPSWNRLSSRFVNMATSQYNCWSFKSLTIRCHSNELFFFLDLVRGAKKVSCYLLAWWHEGSDWLTTMIFAFLLISCNLTQQLLVWVDIWFGLNLALCLDVNNFTWALLEKCWRNER